MEKLDLKDYIIRVTDAVGRLETINVPDFANGLIPKQLVLDIIAEQKNIIDRHNESLPITYTKVMYVEDGSVDIGELTEALLDTKIIVYRKGSRPPELKDIQSNPITGY